MRHHEEERRRNLCDKLTDCQPVPFRRALQNFAITVITVILTKEVSLLDRGYKLTSLYKDSSFRCGITGVSVTLSCRRVRCAVTSHDELDSVSVRLTTLNNDRLKPTTTDKGYPSL